MDIELFTTRLQTLIDDAQAQGLSPVDIAEVLDAKAAALETSEESEDGA